MRENMEAMCDMNRLFEPVRIGPLTVKNRLVMTAMSTCFAGPGGRVSDRMTEYYATRAAGGVGLLTVEEAYIHPQLPHVKNALGIYGDHLIPGLKNLTDRIHREGALASLQVGLYFRQGLNGFPRYVASLQAPDCTGDCRELTADEIAYLTQLFVKGAERAQRAGFDAVEIHACHGCLLAEFLSPYWNHRTDEYGRDRSGRFRFALEILAAIRSELGSDYPVLFRISGSEFTPDAFTPEDAVALSKALEDGGVSAINVSGGLGHENYIAIPPGDVPRGLLLPIGEEIKKEVRVPVIVGNSMTPEIACEAVHSAKADLIGLGRPLIADPEWPIKVRQGRADEIRTCLRCNQGCFAALRDPRRSWISCMYNPVVGREFENPITTTPVKQRVAVIGGGPAGCEVARVASLRGHEVILLEKSADLGGQVNLASIPPKKGDFSGMSRFYRGELERLGVDLRLQTEATESLLKEIGADVYVFATGSVPARPPIRGADLPHVFTAHDVLESAIEIDRGPVVIIGGGATGLETADFLSEKGLPVSVVEMLDAPGREIVGGIGIRESILARLCAKDVIIHTGHRAVEILDKGVVVSDRPLIGGGTTQTIMARSVVLALGMKPSADDLEMRLPGNALYYKVGDCQNPANAFEAIRQAFDIALKI